MYTTMLNLGCTCYASTYLIVDCHCNTALPHDGVLWLFIVSKQHKPRMLRQCAEPDRHNIPVTVLCMILATVRAASPLNKRHIVTVAS